MITDKHKEAILKALGKNHISKIMTYARENNIRKDDGKEFSHSAFSRVLNGSLEHSILEDTIFAAASFHLLQKEKKEQQRKSFVEKVKTKK